MYLRVANSQPVAPPPGVRVIPMPTVITPAGVQRGMGYVVIGSRGMGLPMRRPLAFRRRGMGADLVPVSSFTGSGLTAQDILSYEVPLGSEVQAGTAPSPAQVQALITQDISAYCAQWPDRCPSGVPTGDIAAAVADYQTKLAAAQAQAAAGGSTPYYSAPSQPAQPAPQTQTTPPPRSPAPAGMALGVRLENLSGASNTQFNVGDNWRITVTGPANTQVTGNAAHNGKSGGSAPFGMTDSSGQAVLTGTMTPDTVGGWVEQWSVGGQNAGSVSFSVAALAAPAGTTGNAGNAGTTTAAPPQPPAPSPSGFNLSALSNTAASVGGFSIPWWALLGGGALAIYAFSGSRGKR